MYNAPEVNKPIKMPQMLTDSDNIYDFGNRVKTCRMDGDSMQPTIEPCEIVAFVDCGGHVLTPGIYVLSRDVFGHRCLFVKRVEPLTDGTLKIISDNHRYETFTIDSSERKNTRIHGMVVASLAIRRFI